MRKVLIVLIALILSGCIQVDSTYEVKSDSTVSLECKVLIKENESFVMNDEYFNSLTSMIKGNNQDFESIEFSRIDKTIDNEKWSGVSFVAPSQKSRMIEEIEIEGVQSLQITLSPYDLSQGLYWWSYFDGEPVIDIMRKEYSAKFNVTIIMPNKATTNYGKAKGNKVEINMLELGDEIKEYDIIISSAREPAFPIIKVLGVLVLIIVIIVLYMKRKKISKKEKRELNKGTNDYQDDDLSETIIVEQE